MRVTVGDPGSCGVRIFLNGNEEKQVVIADDEAGYIVRYVPNEEKNTPFRAAIFEPNPNCVLQFQGCVCEVLTGKVEIRGVEKCPHCQGFVTADTSRCPACERLIG